MPPANFWPQVREVCDRHGVLLIADEVVTGFGRGGAMFGTRLWGVKADLCCLAKGISSGYVPLGATAISHRVADVFDADTTGAAAISHGYTYSAHPVAAAAIATLKILVERDIPGHVARVAPPFRQRLRGLVQRHACVGEVRGMGLMSAAGWLRPRARPAGCCRSRGAEPDAVIRPETARLVLAARAAGCKLAILSNELGLFYGRALRQRLSLIRAFDVIVGATYTGVLKPDRRAHEDCLSQLGVAASATLFVDDQWRNIEGARQVGMPALHFDVLDPARSVQAAAGLLGLAIARLTGS